MTRDAEVLDSIGCQILAEEVGSGASCPSITFLVLLRYLCCDTCLMLNMPFPSKAMSVAKASAISAAFVADGCPGVSAKNLASSGRNRDFWRWMRLPFSPYEVKLPLLAKNALDKHIVHEPVAMILPTDMIEQTHKTIAFGVSIFGPSGFDSLKDFWHGQDQSWMNDIGLTPSAFDSCIPMFWHEDSVPSFKDESYTFWSWTALSELGAWQSRVCLVGLASSRVKPCTRSAIMKVLAWNLQWMAEGRHPDVDENGMPWPDGSTRKLKAGTPVAGGYTARFCSWQGDMEARNYAHCLTGRHYSPLDNVSMFWNCFVCDLSLLTIC